MERVRGFFARLRRSLRAAVLAFGVAWRGEAAAVSELVPVRGDGRGAWVVRTWPRGRAKPVELHATRGAVARRLFEAARRDPDIRQVVIEQDGRLRGTHINETSR